MRLFTSVVVLLHMLVASLVVRVICAFIFAITRAAIRLQAALRTGDTRMKHTGFSSTILRKN